MRRSDPRLHVLQHALGLDEHGRDRSGALAPSETYRNRFVTDDDSDDGVLCNALAPVGLTPERADEARRLRADGLTTPEIARRLGVAASTVWKALRRGTSAQDRA